MRWPWEWGQVPTKTATSTGMCEQCCESALIALASHRGWRTLCWQHYCAEMAAQRAALAKAEDAK